MHGPRSMLQLLSVVIVPTLCAATAQQPTELTYLAKYQGLAPQDLVQALPDGRWAVRTTPEGVLVSIRNADHLLSPDELTKRGHTLSKRAVVSCTGSYLGRSDLAVAIVDLGIWCDNGGGITGVTGKAQTSGNAVVAVCNDSLNQQYCASQEIWDAWTVVGQFCNEMESGWWYDEGWAKGYAFDIAAKEAGVCMRTMR